MSEGLSRRNGPTPHGPLAEGAYRALFEATLDAIMIVDDHGRYVDVNDSLCQLLQVSRERLLGASFGEFIPPGRLEEAQAAFAALRSAGSLRMEFPLHAADGNIVELEWCSRADFLPGLHFCVAREVTQRKRAEEALQREHAFRQAIEDAIPAGVAVADLQGRQTYVNPAFCRLVGWGERELLGAVPPYVYWAPEELEAIQTAFAAMLRGEAPTGGFELKFQRQSGERFDVLVVVCPLRDGRGETSGWLASFSDVTERLQAEQALRASEARYRGLFEHSPTALWEEDFSAVKRYLETVRQEGVADLLCHFARHPEAVRRCVDLVRVLDVNAATVRLYEADSKEHLLGSLDRVFTQGSLSTFAAELLTLWEGQTSFEAEAVNRTLTGRAIHVTLRLSVAPGFEETWGKVFISVLDVTERRRLELEVLQRAQQLAEVDRRKDEFLAILGHELRNPLAPLRNALAILEQESAAGPARLLHEMMERQVRTLTRLTDELLDISRVRRGKVELRKEVVDLGTVIGRAVETSRPLVEQRGHHLSVALDPEPLRLEADSVRIEQVLANLLNNAARYTEQGGHIWLEAKREGDVAVVSVRDTGIGLRSEVLAHLFQPFRQADRLPGRVQEGLGIGLALVRGLVELHGGTVAARSEGTGKGSEFLVRLPLLAHADPAGARADSEGRRPGGPRRRVLIVDDNADAAQSLALFLDLRGHAVHCAHDGPAALAVVEQFLPDVVFLDIGMPGMDGYEVARRLRARQAGGLLLVALTGYGQDEDRRRGKEAGFDHHLVKPVEPAVLQEVLSRPASR